MLAKLHPQAELMPARDDFGIGHESEVIKLRGDDQVGFLDPAGGRCRLAPRIGR